MSFQPQTPQSPSQASPKSGEPLSSMNTSMTSMTSALPTPAHSVNGNTQPTDSSHDMKMGEDIPQKRKRLLEDSGDREQKKVHIEERRLGIEALHQDVGSKYLLCNTPKSSSISVSQDLFAAFDLDGIAAEVARTLPNGEKNALRRSYKGHLKKLKINGDFESIDRPVAIPSGNGTEQVYNEDHFEAVFRMPQDIWDSRFVRGKEIWGGLSTEVESSLRKAMTMTKGSVPKNEWDSKVLGPLSADKVTSKPNGTKIAAARTTPNTPVHPAVARSQVQQPATQEAMRSRRAIPKRKYDDNSFDGYRDTFDDDGGMDTGYSTGEGEGSGQKRRKKNPGPAQFTNGPVRQQIYGPGMVGA